MHTSRLKDQAKLRVSLLSVTLAVRMTMNITNKLYRTVQKHSQREKRAMLLSGDHAEDHVSRSNEAEN